MTAALTSGIAGHRKSRAFCQSCAPHQATGRDVVDVAHEFHQGRSRRLWLRMIGQVGKPPGQHPPDQAGDCRSELMPMAAALRLRRPAPRPETSDGVPADKGLHTHRRKVSCNGESFPGQAPSRASISRGHVWKPFASGERVPAPRANFESGL